MRKLQIVRIENDLVQKANLQVGNNIISCGNSAEVNNGKTVKNAVTINLSPRGEMTLSPCQVLPCYIKTIGSSRWKLLKFGTTVPVKAGDICYSLSNKCCFKIMAISDTMEKDDQLLKRKCAEELASEQPDKKMCLDASPKLVTSHGDSLEFQDNKDPKLTTTEKKTISSNGDSIDASTFSKDTNASLQEINQTIPSPMSVVEGSHLLEQPSTVGQKSPSIKKEEVADVKVNINQDHATHFNDRNKSHTLSQQDTLPSSMTEQNETGASNSMQAKDIRNKCIYADKCYRKNPSHKVQFSHPGDPDFEIVDERPECPYGVHCYRKNLEHRAKFKHSTLRKRRAPTPLRPITIDNEDEDELWSEEESVDESDEYEPSDYSFEDEAFDWDDAENDCNEMKNEPSDYSSEDEAFDWDDAEND